MFLGYQNNKVCFMADTRAELENLPCVKLDRIEETQESVSLINGVYCIGQAAITAAKAVEVRAVRDDYLTRYVDPVVSNPLRFAEMTEAEKQEYSDYRRYLLDVPESEGFPDVEVLGLEEWKQGDSSAAENSSETAQTQDVEGDSMAAESEIGGTNEL